MAHLLATLLAIGCRLGAHLVMVDTVRVSMDTLVTVFKCTEVAVETSVTVVVAGSRERYDKQNASPTSGSSLRAQMHLPLHGLTTHLPATVLTRPPK
jgi:hypothetical protein